MKPGAADLPLTCRHFGVCGGCTALDVPIAAQLARKQARAAELLGPWLGAVEPQVVLPPRTPRHDRTSLLFPAQAVDGALELGIYRPGTHELEPIADCRIQHKALTALAVQAGGVLRELGLAAYDERRHDGLVRAFRARVMPGTGELLCGVVATSRRFAGSERLAEGLWAAMQGQRDDSGRPLVPVGVALNVNAARGNALLGAETVVLRGRGFQWDAAADLRLRVSFASFYQQHRHAEAILFRPALALAGDVAGLRIVDGYGGVGAFGLRLLRAGAAEVTLVESSPSACADAKENVAHNGFADRATVREEPFGSSPLPACDLLVADPPRAGLMEQGAAAILAAAPPRVLLVSCALESLARDLQRLGDRYAVAALQLCDLFPHTDHVEAITLLVEKKCQAPFFHQSGSANASELANPTGPAASAISHCPNSEMPANDGFAGSAIVNDV